MLRGRVLIADLYIMSWCELWDLVWQDYHRTLGWLQLSSEEEIHTESSTTYNLSKQ